MTQLLQNAACGTALILAAALLRRALGDRLAPGARLCLWGACLFRLLTPAAPASALSLWGLFARPAPARTPQLYVSPPPANLPAPRPAGPEFSWETALGLIWLAVGAALAVRYALSWRRTRRAVADTVPLDREDSRYALLPRCARLREGAMEGAPLTFGAVRPTVVLTPGLEGEALECVLAHEGVHAARRDNLWHYVMALALAVHWWNPAVWLMSRLLRRDIELSCDRAAVKKLGEDRRAQYANTLVTLATQGEGPDFCQTFGRKAAEERIIFVMKNRKTTILGGVLTLTLVLAVTVAFASEPKAPDEESTTVSAQSVKAWSTSADGNGNLKKFYVDLGYLEENLAQHVADGSMPQAMAGQILEQAKALSEDGKGLEWDFQGTSGLVRCGLDENGGYRPDFNVFYKDAEGNLTAVDPATVVSLFILPSAGEPSGYEKPIYVEEGEEIANGPVLGEEEIVYDGGKVQDYEVKFPTFDEDGNSAAADGGVIGTILPDSAEKNALEAAGEVGQRVYNNYEVQPSGGAADGGGVSAPAAQPAETGMADIYQENGYDVDENGYGLVYDGNGQLFMEARWGYLPCTRTDCAITQGHYHKNGQVIYTE